MKKHEIYLPLKYNDGNDIEIITDEDLSFFKNFKRQLKRMLRQLDILITVQDIHTIRVERPWQGLPI